MVLREGLGYTYLSDLEQQAYKIMQKAFFLMATSFDCSQVAHSVDLMKVLQIVLSDNPSIIYFNKAHIQIEESNFDKKIILTGVNSTHQSEKMNVALDTKVNKIISSLKTKSSNEYTLLINLYDSLQRNIRYDKEELQASSKEASKSPASHNAYGALVNRLAVCDGFSSAFTLLAQKLGFECMLVIGRSAYSSLASVDHAWNIVKIQDRYYHMDITWDTLKYNEFGEYSYDYFALNDEEISNDHNWDKRMTPTCLYNDFSYYVKSGLYINNADLLDAIIKTYVNKQANIFRIKVSRSVSLPENAGEYLAQKVIDEAIKFTEHVKISYGWNKNTRCFFAKTMS